MCANTTACCFSKCLYRGRSGSIEGLMDELECMCDSYTKVGQQRDKSNKKQFSLEWQFYAGRSIRALTTQAGNPTWAYKRASAPQDGLMGCAPHDALVGGAPCMTV